MANWWNRNWAEKYEVVNDMYLPPYGEGETYATQIVTAVTKIVFRFYNDGDVFDNNYHLHGWGNDLSSYANWLWRYTNTKDILAGIKDCMTEDDYDELLEHLCEALFIPEMLEGANKCHKLGCIYEEDGPFSFTEYEEEEDDCYPYEDPDDWEDDEECLDGFGEEV